MDEPTADVALLTAVPLVHLQSGLSVCAEHVMVAFGTDAGMTLSEFAHAVGNDSTADVLFYASLSNASGIPKATYRARFVRFIGSHGGYMPPQLSKYRPSSTNDDGRWDVFYFVRDLRELQVPVMISKLPKLNNRGKLGPNFIPHGPLIIDTPF